MKLKRSLVTPDVERALRRVKNRTGERWTLPFVLGCIESGKAGLFEFTTDRHLAWMVVEVIDGFERVLNVWVLEGSPGIEHRDEMVRLIDDLARSVGAKLWKLESPRKGWARVLRGFITSERTVYERALR